MNRATPAPPVIPETPEHSTRIELRVNGDLVQRVVPDQRSLLEFLRYDLGLTGSKQGCDKGDCGACTVLLDGKPVLACITLAAEARGHAVDTVESLASGIRLHLLQEEFVRHGAAQCGFCTPGVLMSAKAWMESCPPGEESPREAIKAALSGNLCRCTGYRKILDAVEEAVRRRADRGAENAW